MPLLFASRKTGPMVTVTVREDSIVGEFDDTATAGVNTVSVK